MVNLKSAVLIPLLFSTIFIGTDKKDVKISSLEQCKTCKDFLMGQPYLYLQTDEGLIYKTCDNINGKPVVKINYKDKGYSSTFYPHFD